MEEQAVPRSSDCRQWHTMSLYCTCEICRAEDRWRRKWARQRALANIDWQPFGNPVYAEPEHQGRRIR